MMFAVRYMRGQSDTTHDAPQRSTNASASAHVANRVTDLHTPTLQ